MSQKSSNHQNLMPADQNLCQELSDQEASVISGGSVQGIMQLTDLPPESFSKNQEKVAVLLFANPFA